jgi:hypothetical protein
LAITARAHSGINGVGFAVILDLPTRQIYHIRASVVEFYPLTDITGFIDGIHHDFGDDNIDIGGLDNRHSHHNAQKYHDERNALLSHLLLPP